MPRVLDVMLRADRADQLIEAIQGVNALSEEFDTFLKAETKSIALYAVRGKIQRIRDFLKICREQGIPQGQAAWHISRGALRLPPLPEVIKNAAAAQSLIWNIFQGNTRLDQVLMDSLSPTFFGVLAFDREQLARNKTWDWVTGLDLLEADARAAREAAALPKKGLFSSGKTSNLEESAIKMITAQLRKAAGIESQPINDEHLWQAFVETVNVDASIRFLSEQPELIQSEALVNWLDTRLTMAVAVGKTDEIKNLATKSAIIITARQFGIEQLRQQMPAMKQVYESVLEGAQFLKKLFNFVDASSPEQAADYFARHPELADREIVDQLFDQQVMNMIHVGDTTRYRRFTDRCDLWRNLMEFDAEEGIQQHKLFLSTERDEKTIQAEMGIVLLADIQEAEEIQEIISRFPAVASHEALSMVNKILGTLSRQGANDDYNRYAEIKRLIERCLQVGVDRALAQLK
jgi:hypothetical protein